MPVNIDIPMRITIPTSLSIGELASLEAAVGRATTSALSTIKKDVLSARGNRPHIQLYGPNIRFNEGSSDSTIDATEMQAIERTINRGFDSGLAQSQLTHHLTPIRSGQEISQRSVAEPFDPTRAGADGYEIPSFLDGQPVTMTTEQRANVDRNVSRLMQSSQPLTGRQTGGLLTYFKNYGFGQNRAGSVGIYARFEGGGTFLVYLLSTDQGPVLRSLSVGHVDLSPDQNARPLSPSAFLGVLSVFPGPVTLTAIKDLIGTRLADHAAASDSPVEPPTDSELASLAQQLLTRPGTNQPVEPGLATIGQITWGGAVLPLVLPYQVEGAPITFRIHPSVRGGGDGSGGVQAGARFGSGGGSDNGDGDGGGGEGETMGDGSTPAAGTVGDGQVGGTGDGGVQVDAPAGDRVWPTLGGSGEPLVCEPFRGEPLLDDLVVGKASLEIQMRRLAATIDVPECRYIGKFALNALSAIQTRTRAVGVASATSEVSADTTPRPDGSGNNAFVDIQPGDSIAFPYLKLLARATVMANRLLNDVAATYRRKENRHLVFRDSDREGQPDPEAWMYQAFVVETDLFNDALMHLFAESCRVIFLQQLRFSFAAIEERRTTKEQATIDRFQLLMETLGGQIVKLEALRTAIRHAARIRQSGSARTILETADYQTYNGGYGREGVRRPPPPPPSNRFTEQTLASIAEVQIGRDSGRYFVIDNGRELDVEAFDAQISRGRATLNQFDPLFLQLGDLQPVYKQVLQSGAASYVKSLLAEMSKANREMFRKASEPKKGSFFALEASKYLERQGGVGPDGLRYELQGIHKLAYDVLKSEVSGRDQQFSRNVNRAIDIKANFDSILQVFSVVGVIAVAVLCAPLGPIGIAIGTTLFGAAFTYLDVLEADRAETQYRGLENPEMFMGWEEVQLARLMANIGIALSVFDVVGIGKAGRAVALGMREGLERAAREAVESGIAASARQTRRRVLREMADQAMENAATNAVTAGVVAAAMHHLLPKVIKPILEPWLRRIAAEHGKSAEVDAALRGLPAPSLTTTLSSTPTSTTSIDDQVEGEEVGNLGVADD